MLAGLISDRPQLGAKLQIVDFVRKVSAELRRPPAWPALPRFEDFSLGRENLEETFFKVTSYT